MKSSEFLKLYDEKYQFTEEELHDLFWGDLIDDNCEFIEKDVDENRRWSAMNCRYYKIGNRYFGFYGDLGLTEYQEDEFSIQPQEVRPIQKKIIVTTWEVI